ncbi:MarR family transcriptional regulator [Nocardioides sp.]|uniref:MarR family winged helix-turn-helix transcriptional regulator n=1 Tax=Nocardioides sp. TaxID=35761 RepID=UPI0025DE3AD2|nr:MarR family transcriptional regulator [Nocardioides sp.]
MAKEQARQVGGPDGNVVLDLFVLHQRVGDLMEVALDGTGIRPAEYAVYSQLAAAALTPRELSARLGVTPSTLTGLLEALARREHIVRERDPADGRSYRVRLTDAGRDQHRNALGGFRRMLGRYESRLPVEPSVVRELLTTLDQTAARVVDELSSDSGYRP